MNTRQLPLNKKDILNLFYENVFTHETLDILNSYEFLDNYTILSGQYVFNKISNTFCKNIRVFGLDNISKTCPNLIVYPHQKSIMDGTLINVLLLKEGYRSKAIARISPDNFDKSKRDLVYLSLKNFIIHLKQGKNETGEYTDISFRDRAKLLRDINNSINKNGVILIAPEGKSNPFGMSEAQDSYVFIAQRTGIPIIPCTIEYHEEINNLPVNLRFEKYYTAIDIKFHSPVYINKNLINTDIFSIHNDIMQKIASSFICEFKRGYYKIKTNNVTNDILNKYIKYRFEKFNPLYHYILQKNDILYENKLIELFKLIEEEFHVPFKNLYSRNKKHEMEFTNIKADDLLEDLEKNKISL